MGNTASTRYARLSAELRREADLPNPFRFLGSQEDWRNVCIRRANLYATMADRAAAGAR